MREKNTKKSRPMSSRIILAALAMADVNVHQVAKIVNKTDSYVWQIIDGNRTGYRVRPLIAKICGKKVEELWPDTPEEYRRAA